MRMLQQFHSFDGQNLGSLLVGLLEVRGQRTGCPSPLSVITPAVIWLAEMLAFPANLISEPGGHLGQITFLLTAD